MLISRASTFICKVTSTTHTLVQRYVRKKIWVNSHIYYVLIFVSMPENFKTAEWLEWIIAYICIGLNLEISNYVMAWMYSEKGENIYLIFLGDFFYFSTQ